MGHVCPWWFAYTFDNPLRPLFHKPEQIFAPYVREGMCVADIGCGLGYFSLGLARMVKINGKVIAVDIQPQMLKILRKRADRSGLSEIIQPHLCQDDDINIPVPLDFALAFWMIHEAPDPTTVFSKLYESLKTSGLLLFTEPLFHVSQNEFQHEVALARDVGFNVMEEPQIRWSHAVTLQKSDSGTTSSA